MASPKHTRTYCSVPSAFLPLLGSHATPGPPVTSARGRSRLVIGWRTPLFPSSRPEPCQRSRHDRRGGQQARTQAGEWDQCRGSMRAAIRCSIGGFSEKTSPRWPAHARRLAPALAAARRARVEPALLPGYQLCVLVRSWGHIYTAEWGWTTAAENLNTRIDIWTGG